MARTHGQNEDREFLLSQYLDGQFDDAARSELEAELAASAELRATLEQMLRVEGAVRRWGADVPAVDADRFVAVARGRRETYDRGRRIVRLYRVAGPLAMAAVIGLVVTGYLFIRTGGPERPGSAAAVAVVTVGPPAVGGRAEDGGAGATVFVSYSEAADTGQPATAQPEGTLLIAMAGGTDVGGVLAADSDAAPVF
jgi:anti-sigma factor RsiW